MQEKSGQNKLAIFKGNNIRRIIFNNEWWFSVVDICGALTDSLDLGAYWRKLKQRLIAEESEVVTFCHGLKLLSVVSDVVAGRTRKDIESQSKKKVITSQNFLPKN